MIINHNVPSMFSHRQTQIANDDITHVSERLSSGLRINRGRDDAAGLAISEKMRAQIRGLRQAARNVMDGISFVQTTEGYLAATTAALQRMRELAVQAANGIYTSEDRMQIQVEINQLVDEVDRIASQAQFNTLNMLTGRFADPNDPSLASESAGLVIHMGANMDERETVFIADVTATALGLYNAGAADNTPISYSTIDNANKALGVLDNALNIVNRERANLGAYQNRMEFAYNAVMIGRENLQASESRIRDADMAEESIDFVRGTILMQSSMAMLAQSNLRPALVLQLLQ
jgi:flagellin